MIEAVCFENDTILSRVNFILAWIDACGAGLFARPATHNSGMKRSGCCGACLSTPRTTYPAPR